MYIHMCVPAMFDYEKIRSMLSAASRSHSPPPSIVLSFSLCLTHKEGMQSDTYTYKYNLGGLRLEVLYIHK